MEFNDPSIVSAVLSDHREGASSTPPIFSNTSPKKQVGTSSGDSNMDQFMNFIKLSKELRANNRTSSSLASEHETSTSKSSDRYIKLLRPTPFELDSSLDFKPDLHSKTHVYSINDLISLSVQVPKAIIDQKLLDLPKRKFWRLHQRHQDYTPHKGVNHRTNSNGSVNSTGNKSTSSLNSSASNLSMSKWRTFSGEGNNNGNNNSNSNNNNNYNNNTGTAATAGTGNYERRNSRVRNMRSGFQSLSNKKQAQLGLISNVGSGKATNGNDNDGNDGPSHSGTPSSSATTTNRINVSNATDGNGDRDAALGNRRPSSAANVPREDKEKAEFMQELDASFEPTGNTAADFEAWRAKMKELDRQKRVGGSDARDLKAKSPVVTDANMVPSSSSGSAGTGGLRTSSVSNTPHHTSNPISDFLNMSRRGTAHGDTPVEALDKDKESSKQDDRRDTVDSDSLATENGGHEMNSRSSSSRFASFFKSSEAAKKEGSKTPLGEEAAAAVTTTNNSTSSVGGSKLMNFFRDSMESNTPSTESVELNSPTPSLNVTKSNGTGPKQGFFMDPQSMNPSNSNNIFFANLLNKNKTTTGGRDSPASSPAVLMAPPGLPGPAMPMHPMNDAKFAENLPPPGLQFPPGPPGPHMLPHNFPPQMMATNPPPGMISPPDNRGNSNRSVDIVKNDGTASITDKERSTSNNSTKSNGTLNRPDQQVRPQMEQRQQQQQQQFMPMMAPPMGFMPMSGIAPNMQFPMPPPKVGFPPQPANGQGQMQPSFPLPPLPPPHPGNMAMGPLQQPRNVNANISISTNSNTLPPGVPRNGNSGPFIPGGNMQGFFPPGFIPPQQLQQPSSQQGQRQPMNMPMPQK